MKIKNNFKIRIYLQFAIMIFISCLILVSISYYGYSRTLTKIKDQRLQDALGILDKQFQSLNKNINTASLRTIEIASEQDFIDMILYDNPLQPPHYSKYLELQSTISKFHLTNEYIVESVFVFDFEQPFMMTTMDIIPNPDFYYGEIFSYGNMNYDEFFEYCKSNMIKENIQGNLGNQTTIITNSEEYTVLPFIKPIYIPGTNRIALTVLMVNIDSLIAHMPASIFEQGGQIAIYDRTNNLIAGNIKIDSSQFLVLKDNNSGIITSEGKTILFSKGYFLGATVYMHVPENWINSQMLNVIGILKFYIPVLLLVSLILGAIMTFYYANPLVKIVTNINKGKEQDERIKNVYNYIQLSYLKTYKSSKNYQNVIESWKPLLINGALERLFKGGVIDGSDYDEISYIYNAIPEKYRVLMIEWENDSNIEHTLDQLITVLDQRLKKDSHFILVHIMSPCSICAILDADSIKTTAEKASFDTFIKELFKDFMINSNQRFYAGMGGVYSQISLVSMSTHEAKRAMRAKKYQNNISISWYDDFRDENIEYDMPYETMDKIYQLINSGDEDSVKAILFETYKNYFYTKTINDIPCERYYNDMLGIVNRVINKNAQSNQEFEEVLSAIPEYFELEVPSEIYNIFRKAMSNIAMICKESRNQARHSLKEEIRKYILKNFSNPNMSLKLLSEKFNMSDKYLSLYFKNNIGVNFIEFLEKTRMEEAIILLLKKKLTIKEIQQMVGYTNNSTFYKAFKRRYGVSPKTYCEINRR